MKNRDIAGLAVIGLFLGGLMGISFWALLGMTVIGLTALVFEFVMRMEAAGNPKTARMMHDL
jgi:F0F1-type ATP synthase assembly protein I